jgi:hypothetical protein
MSEVNTARGLRQPGVVAALTAASLFGGGAPHSRNCITDTRSFGAHLKQIQPPV